MKRLELAPQPVDLTAEAPAQAGEPARRHIAGLAVPYEIEARVGFQLVTFAEGSVTVDGASPLLLGHDPNKPVGVLVDHAAEAGGLRATWAVDTTADGDAALTQAQSGSRRGLSVGVDLDTFDQDPDDENRIRVTAARLAETSLVAMAAYPAAGVDQVAAQKPQDRSDRMSVDDPRPPEAPQPDPQPDPQPTQAAPQARVVIAERAQPAMRLGEYVRTLVRAERGDQDARARIEAALTRGNVTTAPGVVPIAYVDGIIDSLGDDRPLYDAMTHAEMPPSGMTIRRPEVATRPDGNWLADDTAGAPSNAVSIINHDVAVKQWAWGGSASVALVERSSPSYIEEIFAGALSSYRRDVEVSIGAAFPVAASTITKVGPAVAQYMTAYRTWPELLVCGADAYGKLLDAAGVLMFSSGNVDAKGNGSYAGLTVVASPDVPAADAFVTARDFVEVRESSPIRLSVSDVTSLSLEIGVTSFYSQTRLRQDMTIAGPVTVAGAVRIATFTPVGLEAQSSSKKS